jgi:hypothetical protein
MDQDLTFDNDLITDNKIEQNNWKRLQHPDDWQTC